MTCHSYINVTLSPLKSNVLDETVIVSVVNGDKSFNNTALTSGAVLDNVTATEIEVVEFPSKSIAIAVQVNASPTLASVEFTNHDDPIAT